MVFGRRPSRSSRSRNRARVRAMLDVAGGVESRVPAELRHEAGVDVTQRAHVQLHDPAPVRVHPAELPHHRRLERTHGRLVLDVAAAQRQEDALRLLVGAFIGIGLLDPMVRGTAAPVVEEGMAIAQRAEEILPSADGDTGGAGQPVDPRVERGGVLHGHRCIRTERGQDPDGERAVCPQRRVVLQRVHRIVGGADDLHVHPGDQGAYTVVVLREECRAGVVDLRRGGGGQELSRDPEVALQLQVRPVIQRVADGGRGNSSPRDELVLVRGIPGNEVLRETARSHRPPLVVVPAEPCLGEAAELPVLRYLQGRKVAVEIDDRQMRSVVMVEPACCLRGEQEVLVHETCHQCDPPWAVGVTGGPSTSMARRGMARLDIIS